MKKSNEKELVQTFEEGFMFPIEVANTQKYYIYGRSHEAVKNGEIFRAIINGQAIKLWTVHHFTLYYLKSLHDDL